MLKKIALVLSVALSVACGGGAASSGGDTTPDTSSSITLANASSYVIYRFFMSSVDEATWGPDQFGSEVLAPGGTFTLANIPCDSYDVRLVDEDGDECIVHAIDICAEDSGWVIDDQDLLACEGWTAVAGGVDASE